MNKFNYLGDKIKIISKKKNIKSNLIKEENRWDLGIHKRTKSGFFSLEGQSNKFFIFLLIKNKKHTKI